MEKSFMGNATNFLDMLTVAAGKTLATEGARKLLDANDEADARDATAAEYQREIDDLDMLIEVLYAERESGSVTESEFLEEYAQYLQEQGEWMESLDNLDAAIEAKQQSALVCLFQGSLLTLMYGTDDEAESESDE